MPHFVSPFQSSFILGRLTSDNIIITQEIIHSLQHKRGKTSYMIVKIDLEKAYDKIEWPFLLSTLRDFNFLNH